MSAAEALIATANGMPWAGVLTAAAILTLSLIMRGPAFGRALAVLGVVTGSLGLVAEVLRPMLGVGYAAYGLLLPVWFGWVGWRLFRLSGEPADHDRRPMVGHARCSHGDIIGNVSTKSADQSQRHRCSPPGALHRA